MLHRSQALAWLINRQRLIAVAGAHGKTTSTGMIVTALLANSAQDPSFVNGGVIESLDVSSAWGAGDIFVVEADESDGTFLLYDTAVALITNVDADHLDHYGSHEAFDAAFVHVRRGSVGARGRLERRPGRAASARGARPQARDHVRRGAGRPTCGCTRSAHPARSRSR